MVETEEMTSAAQVDSAKEPNRSAPIPAMSPTLSPTLSAWYRTALRSVVELKSRIAQHAGTPADL